VRENEDIFLSEVWGRVKKQVKGRVPLPILVRAARGDVWAKRKA
jgi:hypothetical protein